MSVKRQDILLDEDMNPQIEDGDFVCGDSDSQNVNLILQSNKGDFKASPEVGVNMISFIKSPIPQLKALKREINVQLKNDSYLIKTLEIRNDGTFDLIFDNGY